MPSTSPSGLPTSLDFQRMGPGGGLPHYTTSNRQVLGIDRRINAIEPAAPFNDQASDPRYGLHPNQLSRFFRRTGAHTPAPTRDSRRFNPYAHHIQNQNQNQNFNAHAFASNHAYPPSTVKPQDNNRSQNRGYGYGSRNLPLSSLSCSSSGLEPEDQNGYEYSGFSPQVQRPALLYRQRPQQNYNAVPDRILPEERARARASGHSYWGPPTSSSMGYPESLIGSREMQTTAPRPAKADVPIVAPVPKAHAARHRDILNLLIEASERPYDPSEHHPRVAALLGSSGSNGALVPLSHLKQEPTFNRQTHHRQHFNQANRPYVIQDVDLCSMGVSASVSDAELEGQSWMQSDNTGGLKGVGGGEVSAIRPPSPATLIALTEPFLMSWCFDDAAIERLTAALES